MIFRQSLFRYISFASDWSKSELPIYPPYDRGSTFPEIFFLNEGGGLAQNRRNANLVSKNDVSVYLDDGIFHRDAI